MRTRFVLFLAHPAAAFCTALLVRLGIILLFLHLGFYENPETWENGEVASHIFKGEGFSTLSWGSDPQPTSIEGPGYPYLLVAVWHLFGQRPEAYVLLSLLQAVAVSSMIFPIHGLTRRWFGTVPAMLAVWVCAFAPLYLWFPTRMHHTALVMSLHPWILLGWLTMTGDSKRPARRRRTMAVAVGALTGVAALFQPLLLIVYGILAGVLLVWHLAKHHGADATIVVMAGMATLLVLTPWTIRNYRVHGRLILVKSIFPKNLWMGNNPYATGTSFAEGGQVEITVQHPPKAFSLQGKASEIELMDALEAEAWAYIRAEPTAFLERTALKILWFWTTPPERVARSYGGATLFFRSFHLAYWLGFLTLTLVALWTARVPREYLALLCLYISVYSLIYGLGHVGQPRYRGEIEFIFLPAVSAGAAWMVARLLPGTYAALVRAGGSPGAQRV